MTPYGRYLYSIGKFMPHSYEFVDDDVVYKMSGSTETQEAAHSRITDETPKLKINRAFQDESQMITSPSTISDKRIMVRRMDQRQSELYCMGRSSYSSDNIPLMHATMLQGTISGSSMTYTMDRTIGKGGEVFIPQIDIDFNFTAYLHNTLELQDDYEGGSVRSSTFSDGTYVDIRYVEPIVHLKEFNSFYEKENFDIEVFRVHQASPGDDQVLVPLKMQKKISAIVNGLLVDLPVDSEILEDASFDAPEIGPDSLEYFFNIEVDTEISPEELCKAVDRLEINSQFLDEELICPDQRTEQFDIYSTRVGPEDLEDCD